MRNADLLVTITTGVGQAMPVEENTMETTMGPYAFARGEGEMLWFLGTQTWVKATSDQTGDALGLVEQVPAQPSCRQAAPAASCPATRRRRRTLKTPHPSDAAPEALD